MALSRPFRAPTMFKDAKKVDIDMLLLGKTGTGKSATGNSILLRKAFKSSSKSTSVTAEVKSEWSKYTDGDNRSYDLKVTDGPGLEDTNLNKMQDKKRTYMNIAQILSECPEGIHVFLLVVRMGTRFTAEDKKALESLKEILGNDYLRQFGIVIITGGDDLYGDEDEGERKTFHDWCREQDGELRKVMQECDNRCVLFDNRTTDEAKRKEQLNTLLEAALEIMSRNNGERYSNETFMKLKTNHRKLMNDCNVTKIKEEFRKQLSILGGDVPKIANEADVELAQNKLGTLLGQVEYEIKVTPRIQALKDDLLILKGLLDEVGNLIKKGQPAASTLKKATLQCQTMIKRASPPEEPGFFEKLCAVVGFPLAFLAAPVVAVVGGPVGLAAAGMLGGAAAGVGGLHAIDSRNSAYRY